MSSSMTKSAMKSGSSSKNNNNNNNNNIRGGGKPKKNNSRRQHQHQHQHQHQGGLKVVHISNPMKVEVSPSEFRSLVQELTGRHAVEWPDHPRWRKTDNVTNHNQVLAQPDDTKQSTHEAETGVEEEEEEEEEFHLDGFGSGQPLISCYFGSDDLLFNSHHDDDDLLFSFLNHYD